MPVPAPPREPRAAGCSTVGRGGLRIGSVLMPPLQGHSIASCRVLNSTDEHTTSGIHRRRQHGGRHLRRLVVGRLAVGSRSPSLSRWTSSAPRIAAARPGIAAGAGRCVLARCRHGDLGRQAAELRRSGRPLRRACEPALQLSVMAGVRSDAIAQATGSQRVVRAMPNTPALIGKGIWACSRAPPPAPTTAPTSSVCWPPPATCSGSAPRPTSMR